MSAVSLARMVTDPGWFRPFTFPFPPQRSVAMRMVRRTSYHMNLNIVLVHAEPVGVEAVEIVLHKHKPTLIHSRVSRGGPCRRSRRAALDIPIIAFLPNRVSEAG